MPNKYAGRLQHFVSCLKYDQHQLTDRYWHIMLHEVQTWINANPNYSISAGMGIWSLQYKGRWVDGASSSEFINYNYTCKHYSYVDEEECERHDLVGLRESFKPVGELIEAFEAQGIYLGQNVEPQKIDRELFYYIVNYTNKTLISKHEWYGRATKALKEYNNHSVDVIAIHNITHPCISINNYNGTLCYPFMECPFKRMGSFD